MSSRSSTRWRRAAVGLCLAASITQAQDVSSDRVSLRGFGTLAVTTHDADGIEYRRHVGQSRTVAAHEIGFHSDSLAGLQLNAPLAPRWDAVVQGVVRQDSRGDWTPRVTQAFLRYSPDESLVLRGGRFGYDIYLLSESRQVGYSYLTVRPSQDFYGLVTNDEVDGLDVSYTTRLGRGIARARAFGGRGSDATAMADGTHWEDRSEVVGVSLDYTYRAVMARAALLEVWYGEQAELAGLGEALVATGAPGAVDIGDELVDSRQASRAMQLGVAWDGGPLQAQVLYGHILSDSIAGPSVRATLAQVGYRVGDVTPFASWSRSRNRDGMRGTDLPLLPETQLLIGTVDALQQNMRATQRTSSLGARWDVSSRWALKAQADFTTIDASVLNVDRRATGGRNHMTVLTASADFVF